MHRTVTAAVDADPETVSGIVSDLGTYQEWVDFVTAVEEAPPHPDDAGTAWFVTLRARVGPLARSKRLRMVRLHAARPGGPAARFERRELDGRDHASWILDAAVTPSDGGSRVTMELSYGGRLWSAPLEAVLGSQVDGAIETLNHYARSAA